MIPMAAAWRAGGGEAGRRYVCFPDYRTAADAPFQANDESGFIGAAIVGGFVVVVAAWYLGKWLVKRLKADKAQRVSS